MLWAWALSLLGVLVVGPCVGKKVKIRTGNELDLQGIYSQVLPPVAIYRLIGNDMPPLQMVGQLRWNTQYALDFEVDFPGARRRWILNRIWNDTEFRAIYSGLLAEGVHRRDILLRCFDLDEYAALQDEADRSLYLTSQNEGRNAGIIDGRESGFEWSMILDGNTFITNDSWTSMSRLLNNASLNGNYRYVKIPYHRLHTPQNPMFLTGTTTMRTSLQQAPIKGESQIAFHKLAPELFTLGDTKPGEFDKAKVSGCFWCSAVLAAIDYCYFSGLSGFAGHYSLHSLTPSLPPSLPINSTQLNSTEARLRTEEQVIHVQRRPDLRTRQRHLHVRRSPRRQRGAILQRTQPHLRLQQC